MKQLTFRQMNPQLGEINGVLRIIRKILYFKFNNNKYSEQVLNNLKSKGAIIVIGRKWIRINIFGDKEDVKLGEKEFNVKENSDEEMEEILFEFYKLQYKKVGFEVEEK